MLTTTLFRKAGKAFIAESTRPLAAEEIAQFEWYSRAKRVTEGSLTGPFVGPRSEMVSPWSSNAVQSVKNPAITRIEQFVDVPEGTTYDEMVQMFYKLINDTTLLLATEPKEIQPVKDIGRYNKEEGLSFSPNEVLYLNKLARRIRRLLTDVELYIFAQANSEHCRHKIFNGEFWIDGVKMPNTPFEMIKDTYAHNPGLVISAYSDNDACFGRPGDKAWIIARQADGFLREVLLDVYSVIKAETHNHPTGVSAFAGAGTGTGGMLRDLFALGKGSWAVATSALYCVSELRLHGEDGARDWIYQSPVDMLIRASNGASDYGNKQGLPVINGSTLEYDFVMPDGTVVGYDKPIMMAGGIGQAIGENIQKDTPKPGQLVIVLGGSNYRIGMGGASASSANLGDNTKVLELNSVQRPDPEMQLRVARWIEYFAKLSDNPIVSIHDHGAGGHANCLLELFEEVGGIVWEDALPIGDPTLSTLEKLSNESQERMGVVIDKKDLKRLEKIAKREHCPLYVVGEITGDGKFVVKNRETGVVSVDLEISDLLGNTPVTKIEDVTVQPILQPLTYNPALSSLRKYVENVFARLNVCSKDFLTNKVDRSVGGQIAQQPCVGVNQVTVSDYGLVTKDIRSWQGIVTGQGLAPVAGLIDAQIGSRRALAEALLNIIGTPIDGGLKGIRLGEEDEEGNKALVGISASANWMAAASVTGEMARLYKAIEAIRDIAITLGVNIPTGKDSTSMVQKYADGSQVVAPLTVILSAFANVLDVRKRVTPELRALPGTSLIRIDFSRDDLKLGGSSFARTLNQLGDEAPDIKDFDYFKQAFDAVQQLIREGQVIACHDVSDGGLVTAIVEMVLASGDKVVPIIDLDPIDEPDTVKVLFAENAALVLQVKDSALEQLNRACIKYDLLSNDLTAVCARLFIQHCGKTVLMERPIDLHYDWSDTSLKLEERQSNKFQAGERRQMLGYQPLQLALPDIKPRLHNHHWRGLDDPTMPVAATIRDEGSNGEKEMQFWLRAAGFQVKDITMTDLESGEEDLTDAQFIVFVGGFSNSDAFEAARGWAGYFTFGGKAKTALDNFLTRPDTMSFGVCNGCQLMIQLGYITPNLEQKPQMLQNDSGKFESAFLSVDIPDSPSIILRRLVGSRMGIWVAHGEGKMVLPGDVSNYNIALTYTKNYYPGNPNGSDYNAAAIVSADGRHLAMMPHPERCLRPHNWGWYPHDRAGDYWTPWADMFLQAFTWCQVQKAATCPNHM